MAFKTTELKTAIEKECLEDRTENRESKQGI